jgi:hypothetical protein
MSSTLFDVMKMLESAKIHFTLSRDCPDAITVRATTVGERIEIYVFEDGHVEVSRFRGDESIEGGMDVVEEIVKRDIEDDNRDWTRSPRQGGGLLRDEE